MNCHGADALSYNLSPTPCIHKECFCWCDVMRQLFQPRTVRGSLFWKEEKSILTLSESLSLSILFYNERPEGTQQQKKKEMDAQCEEER
ncbi:hypothetical protein CEXT_586571 [Caerostris extrusa]|uniref:Uncharacterized protein n=1 Tax=Caerostris extrusa TaxID=172846 RepID=A0AAV4RA59_CAEEX|nr:hypothetical protein CEXT_586571 [Caerostris extrusa]